MANLVYVMDEKTMADACRLTPYWTSRWVITRFPVNEVAISRVGTKNVRRQNIRGIFGVVRIRLSARITVTTNQRKEVRSVAGRVRHPKAASQVGGSRDTVAALAAQ